jgi:hypothetical protein
MRSSGRSSSKTSRWDEWPNTKVGTTSPKTASCHDQIRTYAQKKSRNNQN